MKSAWIILMIYSPKYSPEYISMLDEVSANYYCRSETDKINESYIAANVTIITRVSRRFDA